MTCFGVLIAEPIEFTLPYLEKSLLTKINEDLIEKSCNPQGRAALHNSRLTPHSSRDRIPRPKSAD